jgi:hypothetical protein
MARAARRGPRRLQPGPVPARAAGGWGGGFRKWVQPPPIPIQMYQHTGRGPIAGNGINSGVISAGGSATVSVGPSGTGCRWYPQSVSLATATGAADASTALVYLGAIANGLVVGTSYAAGGDQVGLAVPMMQPGDLLLVVWSGGHPGDWANMQVIGDLEALTL